MPVLSCGGMRYQYKWSDVPPADIPAENQANLEATIHRAVELGINHIETARGYGSSEMQLGNVLPKLPRKQILVQTKVAPLCRPGGVPGYLRAIHEIPAPGLRGSARAPRR